MSESVLSAEDLDGDVKETSIHRFGRGEGR